MLEGWRYKACGERQRVYMCRWSKRVDLGFCRWTECRPGREELEK